MNVSRLFVALLPPADVRAELAELAVPLPGARWTPADNIHLTLRFLGDTTPERQAQYEESLARVSVEPFILPVGDVGLFPSRGPTKVIWAGVGRGHTRLYQLRKRVDEALLAVDAGLDVHSFHPHFTVARLGPDYDAKRLAKFIERRRAFEAPPFRVAEFHLMASELEPGRPPRYRSLRAFAL